MLLLLIDGDIALLHKQVAFTKKIDKMKEDIEKQQDLPLGLEADIWNGIDSYRKTFQFVGSLLEQFTGVLASFLGKK